MLDSGYESLLLPSLLAEDVFSVFPRNPISFHTRRCKSGDIYKEVQGRGHMSIHAQEVQVRVHMSIHTHIVHSVREHMSIQRKARQEHHTCIQDHTNVYNQSVKVEAVKDQTHVDRQM